LLVHSFAASAINGAKQKTISDSNQAKIYRFLKVSREGISDIGTEA
jgi:hypothetical protein